MIWTRELEESDRRRRELSRRVDRCLSDVLVVVGLSGLVVGVARALQGFPWTGLLDLGIGVTLLAVAALTGRED